MWNFHFVHKWFLLPYEKLDWLIKICYVRESRSLMHGIKLTSVGQPYRLRRHVSVVYLNSLKLNYFISVCFLDQYVILPYCCDVRNSQEEVSVLDVRSTTFKKEKKNQKKPGTECKDRKRLFHCHEKLH